MSDVRPLRIGVAVLGMLAGMLGAAAPALADGHAIHPGLVDANPADNTPDVLDGHVDAFVRVGSLVIASGSFSQVSQGGTTYTRHNIVAFDANTGAVSTTFRPHTNGEVFDLQLSRNKKGVYVVGDFTKANGRAHTNRAALLNVSDGKVNTHFRSPGFDREIKDIAYSHGAYYVAGDFTRVGKHTRLYVAALDSKGRDTGRAKLSFTGTNHNGRTHVTTMDMSSSGSTMVVAGNFVKVNGKRRPQLAVLRITAKHTKLANWATERLAPHCGTHFDSYVRDVAISPDGKYFVLANTGGPKGIQSSGLLCDTVTRWSLARGTGKQPTWIDYTGGDTLTAAIVDTNAVYIGGHERWLNNSYGRNHARKGAVERPGIAALDPVNGLPYSWNPTRPRGYGVYGFALMKGGLWVGHDTGAFGGEPHMRIAFCPNDTLNALPAYKTAKLPGALTLLGAGSTDNVVARSFNGTATSAPTAVGSTQTWQDARGTFVVDGQLFAGWSDHTMTVQSYDGTTLGAPSAVDLHKAFPDLDDVRSMFFDRGTHRLYYTVSGSTRLYYRYFQPESQVVGSWRFTVKAASKVHWDRVSGAFLVKNKLFYVDSPTGTLRRVAWNLNTHHTVGAPTTLLGPAIDHVNYRSAAVVLAN